MFTFKDFLLNEATMPDDDNPEASNVPTKFKNAMNKLLRANLDAYDIIESLMILQKVFEDMEKDSDALKKDMKVDPEAPSRKKGIPVKELITDIKDLTKDVMQDYFRIQSKGMMARKEKPKRGDVTPTQQNNIIYFTLINEIINNFKNYPNIESVLANYTHTIQNVLNYLRHSEVEIPHADDVYVARKTLMRDISKKKRIRAAEEAIAKMRTKKRAKRNQK